MNYFPNKKGISRHYWPHMIVSGWVVYFQNHLKYSFGDYVKASLVNNLQGNEKCLHNLDASYSKASTALQGGHVVMDLATGEVVARPKSTPCVMTKLVIT